MEILTPKSHRTHEVINQAPALTGYNLFLSDPALVQAVRLFGNKKSFERIVQFGNKMGSEEVIQLGFLANEHLPELKTHDRFGIRKDQVEFHPSWHELMSLSMENGLHCDPWFSGVECAHVTRAAMYLQDSQNESGHGCPITMAFAAMPLLQKYTSIDKSWIDRASKHAYDPSFRPHIEKRAITIGMAMTEKQGGSDLRTNTTQASLVFRSGDQEWYTLTGHKWFCSAPMCDAFFVLGQTSKGLTCFMLPRWSPDGKINNIRLYRLKNKLGNRSNATSEMEMDEALALKIGEEGRGVPVIVEMVNHTRFDCVIGSTGLMRQAFVQAYFYAQNRSAFGKCLLDQPLMQNVLSDLAIESEGNTWVAIRLANAFDQTNSESKAFRRIATAISKYFICKRAATFIAETCECLGGNGYVEETMLPRLYRDALVNSIWEGSGNVNCLDVLRIFEKEKDCMPSLLDEFEKAKGMNPHYDSFLGSILDRSVKPVDPFQSRKWVEDLALTFQAGLLLRYSSPIISQLFCETRLLKKGGFCFGTLPDGTRTKEILERSFQFVSNISQGL